MTFHIKPTPEAGVWGWVRFEYAALGREQRRSEALEGRKETSPVGIELGSDLNTTPKAAKNGSRKHNEDKI